MGGGMGRPDTSDRTLYVGNLPYESTEQDVKDLFAELGAGAPQRVHLPADAENLRCAVGVGSADGCRVAGAGSRTVTVAASARVRRPTR